MDDGSSATSNNYESVSAIRTSSSNHSELGDSSLNSYHWPTLDAFQSDLPSIRRFYCFRAKPGKKELEMHPNIQKFYYRCVHFKPPDTNLKLRTSQHPSPRLSCSAHYLIVNCNPNDPDLLWILRGVNTHHCPDCVAHSGSKSFSTIKTHLQEIRQTPLQDTPQPISWQDYLISEKEADMKLSRTLKYIRARYHLPSLSMQDCRTVLRLAGLLKGDALENDTNEFLSTLESQQENRELRFYNRFHLNGPLQNIVWVYTHQVVIARENNQIWSMDATFNITRYCLTGVVMAALTKTGTWIPILFALFEREPAESYEWLLKKAESIFGTTPKLLITDQGSGECAAIRDYWPDVHHSLCAWHIAKKLTKKFSHWKLGDRMRDIFWSLVKFSGTAQEAMALIWKPFKDQFVTPEMQKDEEFKKRVKALSQLLSRCGRPYAKVFTAGVLATSGSESLFHSLKSLIGMKETSLMSFLQSAKQCLEKAIYRYREGHLQRENLIEANFAHLFEIQRYHQLKNQLCLPAVRQFAIFHQRSENYRIQSVQEDIHEGNGCVAKIAEVSSNEKEPFRKCEVGLRWRLATNLLEDWACTCQRNIWLQIPCHHVLCLVRFVMHSSDNGHEVKLSIEMFGRHWQIQSENNTDFSNMHSQEMRSLIREVHGHGRSIRLSADDDTAEIQTRSDECIRFFRDVLKECQLPEHVNILDQQLDIALRLIRGGAAAPLRVRRKRGPPAVKSKHDPRSKTQTQTRTEKPKSSSPSVSSSSSSSSSSSTSSSSSSSSSSASSSSSTTTTTSSSSSTSSTSSSSSPSKTTITSIGELIPAVLPVRITKVILRY
jgi:hypothetical protein